MLSTAQQSLIAQLLTDGKTVREICGIMHLSPNVVVGLKRTLNLGLNNEQIYNLRSNAFTLKQIIIEECKKLNLSVMKNAEIEKRNKLLRELLEFVQKNF